MNQHDNERVGAQPPTGWVRLARLGRPHGLKGFMKAHTRSHAAAAALAAWIDAQAEVWLAPVGHTRLRAGKRHADTQLVAIQGVYTPERARDFTHADVWVPREALPDGAGTPLAERLEGAPVLLDGAPFGRVSDVLEGAQVLVGVRDDHHTLHWLPWGAPYVAWDGEVLRVTAPPAGLLGDG